MRTTGKAFESAGSKRVGEPGAGHPWPVFDEYAVTKTDDDILLEAVVSPVRSSRPPGLPPEIKGVMNSANWADAQNRSVKRNIAPLTEHKDLFLKFARYIPNGPVPTQEALGLVRAWISEYGVLGLAGVDDGLNAGRRESVRGFWKAASQAAMILDLYEASIPKKPDQRLGEVLVRWEPGVDWNGIPVSDQREYALGRVGDVVGRIVKEECYPLLWRQVSKTRSRTQGFTYDFGFHSLLGAMYLQMMLLLTDANNVRRCQRPGCQRIIPPYDRSDKKTCSDACRKWISENK